MTDPNNRQKLIQAIAEGLDRDEADIGNAFSTLKNAPFNQYELLAESITFLKQLTTTETPSDPEAISKLDKEALIFSAFRANFFEKIRMPALTDEQLECLLMRTHELWGEHPTEPLGRWVDWCFWLHLHRRRNGVPITEVVAGDKTASDLKQAWVERHQAREERRHLEKVDNYDQYNTPEDVPTTLHDLIMSPFIEDPDIAEVDIDVEGPPDNGTRKSDEQEYDSEDI